MLEINFPEKRFDFYGLALSNNVPFEFIELLLNKKVKTMIDVGSYDGGEAITCRLRNPESEVFCFEPDPELYSELKKLEWFGISTFSCAIGEKKDIKKFYRTRYNNRMWDDRKGKISGSGSLLKPTNYAIETNIHQDYILESIDVQLYPLSTSMIGDYDLLHIDTEGYTLPILKGMGDLRPGIINIEIDAVVKYYEGANTFEEVNSYLENIGYELINRNSADCIYKYKG